MNTLFRNSLLVKCLLIWPVWGLLVVALLANSEWFGTALAVAGWVAWTWILRRLFQIKPEPTRWVWQRRNESGNRDKT